MPADRPRIYWNSNVLLSYIDGDEDRLPVIEELHRQSRAGKIELVTSALSQVEVAFAPSEKASGSLDPEIEARIDELWLPSSPIASVEFHPALARDARYLMREVTAAGRSGLKAGDAIHLATARQLEVQDFHSYDAALQKHALDLPFQIRAPVTAQPQLPGT